MQVKKLIQNGFKYCFLDTYTSDIWKFPQGSHNVWSTARIKISTYLFQATIEGGSIV